MATLTWLGRPRLGQSPGSSLGPAPPRPHIPSQSSGTGEQPERPEWAPVRLPAAARGREGQSEMRSMSTVVETRLNCAKVGGQSGAQGVHVLDCRHQESGVPQAAWIRQEGLGASTMLSEGGQTLANLEPAVGLTMTWYGICYSTQAGAVSLIVASISTICQYRSGRHASCPAQAAFARMA